ncbi:MAG: STING domain-containing protein, partial [Cyclobacteriaceae bacterium]
SNAEQLKNFTDIYDYAIFLFTPDDQLVSQTRSFTDNNENVEAKATRHNVIFEFGLFLGRIGADRTFILYDEGIKSFIDYFFTDLQEDLTESAKSKFSMQSGFKIESYSIKGSFEEYLNTGNKSCSFDKDDLSKKVKLIEEKILADVTKVRISFLPSTSLAMGYRNNFLKRILYGIKNKDNEAEQASEKEEQGIRKMLKMLSDKKIIHFKIVIPNDLNTAVYKSIEKIFEPDYFEIGYIPCGSERPKSIYYRKACEDDTCDDLIIYDIPTTINSSIEAIHMTTTHKEIIELLTEKERLNFEMVMKKLAIDLQKDKDLVGSKTRISVIDWNEFLSEIEI